MENAKEYKGHTIYENERYDENGYRELLDDVYGEVEICGYSYSASDALEAVDPVAFRCGMADSQEYYYTVEDEDGATAMGDEFESIEDAIAYIDDITGEI